MESEYGWHKEGTCIFFDFNVIYIIRKNGKSTAWQQNEPKDVCFCVSDAQSDDNIPKGVIRDRNIVYYNIGIDQCKINSGSVVGDQISGNNMILMNSGTGESSSIQSGTPSYDGGSYSTKEYTGHNPYVQEQYIRAKNEEANQIQLICMGGDMSFLTPNKHYTFLTDVTSLVKNFNGDYRLSEYKTTFSKNGDYFDAVSNIIVKKVSS